jgi:hypothetical protein
MISAHYPTLAEIRDATPAGTTTGRPPLVALRVAAGATNETRYARRYGVILVVARRVLAAGVRRGELVRDVFGVHRVNRASSVNQITFSIASDFGAAQ